MPVLLPTVWTSVNPAVPYVWSCSECRAVFDMGPMHGLPPSQKQIDQVNLQFAAHCQHVHPGSLPVHRLGDALSGRGSDLNELWTEFQQAPHVRA